MDIAEEYTSRKLSVKALCQHYGITRNQLYKKARENNWPGRSKKKPQDKKQSTHALISATQRRESLLLRLYSALNQELETLEKRLAMPDDTCASEHERYARTLTSLVRLFDKLIEIEAQDAARGTSNQTTDQTAIKHNEDAERLRTELAARLERLRPPKS